MNNFKSLIIAYDLGTGGLKASLHQTNGAILDYTFSSYNTYYPNDRFREQRPADWWQSVCKATGILLERHPGVEIVCAAFSGQSIAPVSLNNQGGLVFEQIPIWSDTRAVAETEAFFSKIEYKDWYLSTGNGDPPETYTVFKLMWLKNHYPDLWENTAKVVGSKDYINYKLTGEIATDYSYASGSGLFDIKALVYRDDFIYAAGLSRSILPDLCDSYNIIGAVTKNASMETGLPEGIPVACGGVDNACMALGAIGIGEGRIYTSLGSSAWVAVTSSKPILDINSKPFIFAHAEKGYFTSGVSIFSAGNAYRWVAEQLCGDLPEGSTRYAVMDSLAAKVPAGANGLLFNPSLAGGSSQEPSTSLRGEFAGLSMGNTRADMLRAVLEGVALSLRCYCLDILRKNVSLQEDMLFCGGGAKSPLWNQIFADVFGMNIVLKGNEQEAASLGAAAIAARASGVWEDFTPLDYLFIEKERFTPKKEIQFFYENLSEVFKEWIENLLPSCERLQGLAREGLIQ